MSDKNANITFPVDLNNPGQFFACCDAMVKTSRGGLLLL